MQLTTDIVLRTVVGTREPVGIAVGTRGDAPGEVELRPLVMVPVCLLYTSVFEGGGPDGVVLSLVRVLIGLRVVEGLGDPVLVRNRTVEFLSLIHI